MEQIYYWKEKKEEKKISFPVTESALTDVVLAIDKESGGDE